MRREELRVGVNDAAEAVGKKEQRLRLKSEVKKSKSEANYIEIYIYM